MPEKDKARVYPTSGREETALTVPVLIFAWLPRAGIWGRARNSDAL